MPAHTRTIHRPQCMFDGGFCNRQAEVEVFTSTNQPVAVMCKPHGEQTARDINAQEQRAAAVERERKAREERDG